MTSWLPLLCVGCTVALLVAVGGAVGAAHRGWTELDRFYDDPAVTETIWAQTAVACHTAAWFLLALLALAGGGRRTRAGGNEYAGAGGGRLTIRGRGILWYNRTRLGCTYDGIIVAEHPAGDVYLDTTR